MDKDTLLAQAEAIAGRLNDLNGIWFHYKAINKLGFHICYQLCSLALDKFRRGEVKTSPARYYNGCITREIRERRTRA